MAGSPGEHIGDAELARLLEQVRSSVETAQHWIDVHPHLAVCTDCRKQFQELVLLENQIRIKNPADAHSFGNDCPDPSVWREIAGGLTAPDQTLVHVEHASGCSHCGPLLREAVIELASLNGEVTEAERKQIAALESAHRVWQEKLAQRITATPLTSMSRSAVPWWKAWLIVPRLAFAGTSLLIILAGVGWIMLPRGQSSNANRLLARAYTEKRTFELRIAGAEFAPLRVSLGPTGSFTNRPAALLEAEALIARKLQSHLADPAWLQAKARADLLEGKYDAAVETLHRALELSPHSPGVLTDIATAYFQRGLQADHKEDFGAAYEYLSQALVIMPDDPVALFNRAIVAERQFLYHQAIDDWEHYLRVDPKSQWSNEARDRAEAIREKLKAHAIKTKPLLTVDQIASRVNDASLGPEVDERVEEYLDAAVRFWLPQAFPESGVNANPQALQALFFLADLTLHQHNDHWLTDFLARSSVRDFPRVANALARSTNANRTGEFTVAEPLAILAEKLFRSSGNTAGILRAEFERTWSEQLEEHPKQCRRQAMFARVDAERYSDAWLQIQFLLQQAVCSTLVGNIGADEKDTQAAIDLAQKNKYGALYLRAIFFAADDKLAIGDQTDSAALIAMGLEHYWSGAFAAVRGYSFYHQLARNAEAAKQPYLQVAAWRDQVALIDSEERLLYRALAHDSMANAATAAHLSRLAEEQYAEAARLLAAAPKNEASHNALFETEVKRAQLEAYLGQLDNGIARLAGLQDQVHLDSNQALVQMFYITLGQLQLAQHHEAEAEQAFRLMLRLEEQNLDSLTSMAERSTWSEQAAPVYLGLAEAKLLQGREQESLETFEQYLDAPASVTSISGMDRGQSRNSSFRIATQIPLLTNRTVLAYGVLPDGIAIWAYDNRGLTSKWIQKSQNIEELAGRFYTECSDPDSEPSALRRDGQALYLLLIKPIEDKLDPNRVLVIETQGFLARLPFEALTDANGHHLIERSSIVYSSGPYAEARMHPQVAISHELPALIVGSEASLPDNGLFAVPNVRVGANAIANDFLAPHIFTGSEATLDAVETSLPYAAVFNFEGHAVTDPARTGLLLQGTDARDHTLHLLDSNTVRSLDLHNLQLAFLAACNSDSGQRGSRDLNSVARAFQASGVPHVIASRWTVDALESNAFANSFYSALLSGRTVSSATRFTAQQMLANPSTAHPYYWAAFAAYGRP